MKKILLIGGRGISEVFVRLLKKHNIPDIYLISSSYKNSKINAKILNEKYKVNISPVHNLDNRPVNFSPDGVIIASPNHSHQNYLSYFIKAGTHILCEKPLIWQNDISVHSINEYFRFLEKYKTSNLFLNTPNRFFAKAVKEQLANISDSKSFELTFNTHGVETFQSIGVDLLPHAFSVLHDLFGFEPITEIESTYSSNQFKAKFKFGNINVSFYLSENIEKDKYFSFSIDREKFTRIQLGHGDTYSVFLSSNLNEKRIQIEDPFDTNIQRLLSSNKKKNSDVDDFSLAKQNMLNSFEIFSASQIL